MEDYQDEENSLGLTVLFLYCTLLNIYFDYVGNFPGKSDFTYATIIFTITS